MGFARVPTAEAKRMVEWLRSVDPHGTAKVEVRRYSGGFLHGKAYLVEDGAAQAAIAGSSNMTYAGLAHNAELNLGTGGGTQLGRQGARVVRALLELERPLRSRRALRPLWDPHTPWSIYLRMLWELYGEHLDARRTRTSAPASTSRASRPTVSPAWSACSTSTAACSSPTRLVSARRSLPARSSIGPRTSTGSGCSSSLRPR